MKHPEDMTTIERDLGAVEEALTACAAGHGDPAARELQELALALRADRPVPEPAFARELGAQVAAGFNSGASDRSETGMAAGLARLRHARRGLRLPLAPIAGVVASVLLVAVLVFTVGGSPGDDDLGIDGGGSAAVPAPADSGGGGAERDSSGGGGGDSSGGSEAAPGIAPDATSAGALATPTPPGRGFAPGRRQRRIERSISMTLTAPADEITRAADDVNAVTTRHGGFVLRSALDTGEGGASGSFELRIPAGRLQDALGDLARIATVSSQSQTGQDVTREHVTAKDRLQAARAERRGLLRRLEDASSDSQAEAIRARLDLVAGEINGLRGQLRDLRLRTDYAVVSLDLIGNGDEDDGSSGGAFDDAVGDAGDLLVGFAGVSIRVLALALPLGLIALIGWTASRTLRRRRRESVLA